MKAPVGFGILFLTCLSLVANPAAKTDPVTVVEEIIAKVNGEIITRGDLDKSREQLEADFRARGLEGARLNEAIDNAEKDLLRNRIDELLLVQRAKDLDIKVDSDVTRQIAEYQLRTKIEDQEKFQNFVAEQVGMPFEDFREALRNQMMTRQVLGREVGSKITVPREEIQKYYEEHKDEFVREERVFLSEILISTEGKTGEELEKAKKKAEDLLERARRGERFGELARDNSEAVTAKENGVLSPFKKGELSPEIEKLIWDKEKGYVTDLIELPAGFLILKVEDHQRAGQATLEEVEQQITNILFQPRFEPKVREFLTELREDAYLQIRDGYLDSGAAPGKDTAWMDVAELKPETITKDEVIKQTRRRRLLWLIPIPGTEKEVEGKSSSR